MSDHPHPFFSGVLLLDKPSGPTSHDAVLWARRALHTKKIGHCGALDPLAQGLLLLAMGEALEWQERLMRQRKVYRGSFRLGVVTDTDDITGQILRQETDARRVAAVSDEALAGLFKRFLGPIRQRVPRYSSVKVNGRRLHEWARRGVEMPLPEKTVEISRFDLLSYAPPDAHFVVECSKGTYVRSLARDVGEQLGLGATLASLCRESIGRFSRADAFAWNGDFSMEPTDWERAFIPMDELPALFPAGEPAAVR
ncbi:MAG TPA: tRNA pseudouridine(55) synthase TruB [Elusimicrobiota bacterium]|nr:tRNA pseudouridine(55) synthase TruB [Elusimicrobiota bacterium]